MTSKINTIIAFFVGVIFFFFGVITLKDYGINWDTINHLPRGQAYLHYFLTGNRNYDDLPNFFNGWQTPNQWYFQDPNYLRVKTDQENNWAPNRSLYQVKDMNFDYFIKTDGDGHPPFSDILSSVFNEVLFRKLKLINDVDSYRVYGILMAAITVGLVFYWGSITYGKIGALVASLVISTYPLFWAESHFNTEKDIPETAFWSLFMFTFYKGVVTKNWKLIIASGLLFGMAFGTKLNILFSVFVIAPWFLIYVVKNKTNLLKNWKSTLSLLAIPFLGFLVLILTWPHLWADPIGGILKMFGFYKTIGTTAATSYAPLGINTVALKWVLYTTPMISLILAMLGIFYYLANFKKSNFVISLFILWFLVPIIRVTLPGSNIYGGIRQIMEFIPAMALLSGFAFSRIIKNINPRLAIIIVLLSFTPIVSKLIAIHPNENVYFNGLAGGLSGAKEKNIEYWGFSFGSPYRQAAKWLNENAPANSKLVYTYDLIPNLPRIWLRQDINLYNALRSGYLQEGEYAMGLIYQGNENRSYYENFLNKFVKPVYEVKVDDVSILKIWKNDPEYLISEVPESVNPQTTFRKDKNNIFFDLKDEKSLSRLEVNYSEFNCPKLASGLVSISSDAITWVNVGGYLPDDWRVSIAGEQPKDGHFIEPFVGQNARYIKISLSPQDTCLFNVNNFKVFTFDTI